MDQPEETGKCRPNIHGHPIPASIQPCGSGITGPLLSHEAYSEQAMLSKGMEEREGWITTEREEQVTAGNRGGMISSCRPFRDARICISASTAEDLVLL